ncbi:MAG TPA: tetratricopeptide repeat protein [Bryobacteraceae bacterium]|nr:tetratricopeptide repeat protein [Bryobacteraceae bacterium]
MRASAVLLLAAASILAQNPPANALLRRALEAHQRGDLAGAIRDYRQVLEANPGLTQVRLNLGAALGDLGRLDEAITVFEAAPAADRGNPDLLRSLALAYYRKDDFAAALRVLEKLNAADPRTVAMLADCYLRTGAPAKAIVLIESATRAHPDDPGLTYQLGAALIRAGRAPESLEPLERAGRTTNNSEALLLAGATALGLGQFQRARDDLEAAIRINPNVPGAWTFTGLARDRVSDEEGAKEAFRKALEANPRDFEANLHLGAILYRERELAAAKPYLERAREIQPSSNLALYALALVRAGTGEIERAVAELEAVVRAAPAWLEPHVKLASLYFRLRRQQDGKREQETIEKLKSEHRDEKVPLPELE